jgi:hypothetical protein
MRRAWILFWTVLVGAGAAVGLLMVPTWSVGDAARRLLPLVQKHPGLYWLAGYAALAALVAEAALPLLIPGSDRRATAPPRARFAVLAALTVFLLRWPALASFEAANQQDESLAIAGALTLQGDPRYWLAVEAQTHGPVVEFALLPVRLVGLRLDYGSARLVGLALGLGCAFFLYGALRTLFPESISRAALTPLVICLAFQTFWDYVVYNAEQPTLFLLCAGAYGCARLAGGPASGAALAALATGFALGLVPFAKLQGVPVGLALAVIAAGCLVTRYRGRGQVLRRSALALLAGGLAPSALVALYLGASGLIRHFYITYIGSNLAYTEATGLGPWAKVRLLARMAWEAPDELFLYYFLATASLGLALVGWLHLDRRGKWLILAGGLVEGMSLYAVAAAGKEFTHYLLFLPLPLAFLAAVVVAALHETALGRVGRRVVVAVYLAAAVAVVSLRAYREGNPWLQPEEGSEPLDRKVAAAVRRFAAPGEKLAMWGWMEGCYVLTGMRQATLHSDILPEAGSPYPDYFLALYLRQFDEARPPVFVDTVGPHSFGFQDRSLYAHENYAGLRERIAQMYELADEIDGVRIYVSRERLAERGMHGPPTRVVNLPVTPTAVNQLVWKDGVAKCTGNDPYLSFSLDRPASVRGVRLTLAYEAGESPFRFRMYWKESARNPYTEQERCVSLELGEKPGPRVLTVPVNDTIDAFQIHPDDKPCVFRLGQIELLAMPGQR